MPSKKRLLQRISRETIHLQKTASFKQRLFPIPHCHPENLHIPLRKQVSKPSTVAIYVPILCRFWASLYAKMLMSSNHDAGRGSVIIPIVTTMGANPQSRAVRVFWKMKSMSNRRSPMAGSDARLRTPEAFLLLGTGIISVNFGVV